jgi:hypothetical protein
MEEKLVIKLRDKELINKVDIMRDTGLNVAELIREFLQNYELPIS